MELGNYIKENNIDLNFEAKNKDEALEKLSKLVSKKRNIDYNKILEVLKSREELGSTGIGNGIAIPHGKFEIEDDLIGAIAISKNGVNFESIDNKPVNIFFVFISSPSATNLHLKVLAKVSKTLMNTEIREKLLKINKPVEILNIIDKTI